LAFLYSSSEIIAEENATTPQPNSHCRDFYFLWLSCSSFRTIKRFRKQLSVIITWSQLAKESSVNHCYLQSTSMTERTARNYFKLQL